MSVLAIVPARSGSRGIPNKNFKELAGRSPLARALNTAIEAGHFIGSHGDDPERRYPNLVVTSDIENPGWGGLTWLKADPPLHTDDCAMVDVIKDVLARVPGPEEQIVVLLQPTQPLREPKHVQAAIALLEASQADSVVSVVELPRTHSPNMVGFILESGHYVPALDVYGLRWTHTPARRQDAQTAYMRDGTCYSFRRSTVTRCGNIYGEICRALIIDPSETCPLDTPADWVDAERRLREREG
jgi:CMP-N,N'-diacetyllegionaminic acid synthase